MQGPILLAVALQNWDRYSVHALIAREMAMDLAKGAGVPLHVLSVYDHEPVETTSLSPEMATRHREDTQRRTTLLMEQRLADYMGPLQRVGLDVRGHLVVGNPRAIIVETARQLAAGLLIMGSHSKRGIFDISLGGTAQHVSRNAPCQVALVSPNTCLEPNGEPGIDGLGAARRAHCNTAYKVLRS